MELQQVKSLLHQTECGEMFMDGMGISEPILTQADTGLIDNFFVYLIDKHTGTASGPLARIGLCAESGALVYIISSNDRPLSVLPNNTLHISQPSFSKEEYENYAELYAKIRTFAFKNYCSETEKKTLSDYLSALENITYSSMLVFYREIAPAFFEWARKVLD